MSKHRHKKGGGRVGMVVSGNPDVLEIGTAGESFGKVWQSQDYETFRRAHLDGDIPTACQGCYERR